jgi:DNA-binding transcriptional regulator YhcF (GntR family)
VITIDPGSPISPFEQIRVQLTDLIRAGELTADQRLPSIRQLAADLRIAPGTVAKAYSALEADGLITTSRVHGTRVAASRTQSEQVSRAATAFVSTVTGISLEEALSAVRSAWPTG